MRSYLSALLAAGRARVLAAVLLSIGVAGLEGAGLVTLAPLLAAIGAVPGAATVPAIRWVAGWGLPAILLLWVGLVALHALAAFGRDRTTLILQQRVADHRRSDLFAAAAAMEWQGYTAGRSSDLTTALTVLPLRIHQGTGALLNAAARACLLVVHAAVAIWLAPVAGAAILAVGIGIAAIRARSLGPALSRGWRMNEGMRALQARVEEQLAAMKLVKAWGLAARTVREFNDALTRQTELQLRQQSAHYRASALFRVASAAMAALGLGIAVGGVGLSGAPLLLLAAVFIRLLPAAGDLVQMAVQVAETLPAWRDSQAMLSRFAVSAEQESEDPEGPPVGDIVFSSVSFSWEGRGAAALDDISLTLPVGQTTALIGPSGAGKTTLADLALGLLTPSSGDVSAGGRPLVGAARIAWRRHSAYVPQETFLFHASVRDNLLWGRPDASEALLWQSVRAAQVEDVVRRLPQGLDTQVGDRGSLLSGGERQRLALARALVREPRFLVLDEATSAVDPDSEERILAALDGLRGKLTMLVIAHRLSTVRKADRILTLKAGRLWLSGAGGTP